jgi:hypothetical protein
LPRCGLRTLRSRRWLARSGFSGLAEEASFVEFGQAAGLSVRPPIGEEISFVEDAGRLRYFSPSVRLKWRQWPRRAVAITIRLQELDQGDFGLSGVCQIELSLCGGASPLETQYIGGIARDLSRQLLNTFRAASAWRNPGAECPSSEFSRREAS